MIALVSAIKKLFAEPASGKFGTFEGVFTPSVLTILGVIMYLRFSWVVGHAGLGGALIMLGIAHLLVIPSALAVSSIATNRTVGTGGNYFIISRSLGLEMGGAIGIGLYFAQALSVTLYILGFTEALTDVIPGLNKPITCVVATLAVAGIAFWNTSVALKSQYIIMVLIALSLVSIFTGKGSAPPTEVSWFARTVNNNPAASFGVVFAVLFPAVTGFTQGVSMSGDLEDPRKAIPIGTLAAVATGLLVYVGLVVWIAIQADSAELRRLDVIVLKKLASVGILVTLGIWGATLSSAMGSILGAPRILQALAIDGVAPRFLGKGSGPSNMPRVATVVTLLIALGGFGLAFSSPQGLNAVASVISMFFLATYGFICMACGLAEWSKTPSYRPTFRVPAIVALAGGFGCFYMMSLINLLAMIASVAIMGLIYFGLQRKNLTKTWGDMRHGIWNALIRKGLMALRGSEYHPINWQPNVMVLGGSPLARPHLMELGHWIGGNRGLVTYFFLMKGDRRALGGKRKKLQMSLEERVSRQYPNVFTKVQVCDEIFPGALNVAQAYGVSGFEPNTVVMGWSRDITAADAYADLIRGVNDLEKSILLVAFKEDKGFGNKRSIDIWWGGLENNGGLMLLLTTMLTDDEPWRGARVRVKMIVAESAPLSLTRQNLERIMADARIDAEAEVIVRNPPNRPVTEIIAERSNADLVLLGLRPPDPTESGESFVRRVNAMIDPLPTTVLVKSSADFRGAEMLFDQEWKPPPKSRVARVRPKETVGPPPDEFTKEPRVHPLDGSGTYPVVKLKDE
jgi:amino acid transporter